jgi:hypothetical protein
MLNSVIIAIRGHEYPQADISAIHNNAVPGAATLRVATLIHAVLDFDYTNRVLGRARAPERLHEATTPFAYLGLDHALPLARLLGRDIWIVSPRTPAAVNNTAETGRLPHGSTVAEWPPRNNYVGTVPRPGHPPPLARHRSHRVPPLLPSAPTGSGHSRPRAPPNLPPPQPLPSRR